jgi:hypothetical protein
MTDTVTSQNIVLSSWDTLYTYFDRVTIFELIIHDHLYYFKLSALSKNISPRRPFSLIL